MRKFLLVLLGSAVVASPAIAADLPARTYATTAAMAPLYSWTGCYIGANAGGGSDRQTYTHINATPQNAEPDFSLGSQRATGAIGGGQIGCDYQFGNWVMGAQGLIDATGFRGSNHVIPGPNDGQNGNVFDLNSRTSWLATATARVGYAVQPQLLVYVKGGGAWARSDLTYTAVSGMGVTDVFTGAETRPGWIAGAGLEYLMAENWSIFAEYNHLEFGSRILNTRFILDPTAPAEQIRINRQIDTLMLGVNFRIGPSAR